MFVAARVVLRVVAALRAIGAQRFGGERAFGRDAGAAQHVGGRADDRTHLEEARVFFEQREPDAARVGQALELLADRLENAVEVVLLEQQRAEALQADHLLEAVLELGVQTRVVEADGGLVGKGREQLHLPGVERVRVVRIGRAGCRGYGRARAAAGPADCCRRRA